MHVCCAVPCRAVPCLCCCFFVHSCFVLFCVVLRCVVTLCYDALRCVLFCVALRCVVLRCVGLCCCAVLCCAVLYCVVFCCVVLCSAVFCVVCVLCFVLCCAMFCVFSIGVRKSAKKGYNLKDKMLLLQFPIPSTMTVDSASTLPLFVLALHLKVKAYLLSMSLITRSFPTLTALPMTGLPWLVQYTIGLLGPSTGQRIVNVAPL